MLATHCPIQFGGDDSRAEDWADLGSRMSTLIRLAFGAMDLDTWSQDGACRILKHPKVSKCFHAKSVFFSWSLAFGMVFPLLLHSSLGSRSRPSGRVHQTELRAPFRAWPSRALCCSSRLGGAADVSQKHPQTRGNGDVLRVVFWRSGSESFLKPGHARRCANK